MAISNYSELKASVINWSHRNDLDVLVDDFITLAEADMYKGTEMHEALQLRSMETTSTASISADALALPANFESMRSFRITDDSLIDLRYKTPDALVHKGGTGQPKYYTITSQLEFDVFPDQAYPCEMIYIERPLGITSSNTTNDVLTNHPDIYLYGSLWALFTHADDEAQAQKYYQRFSLAINGANQKDENGRYGSTPYARVDGYLP